ncbi:MAG: hypothetical protein CL947_03425 [Epsilonproteobacteria bacterium]|nr:hypothetical protein [Campylobacterota bacterium]|tara:strand:- start:7153 stop:7440 length:288 start_codon:yes stop_codon:yes gene_type:complete
MEQDLYSGANFENAELSDVEVGAVEANFDYCEVKSIVMKQLEGDLSLKKQTVYLRNTIVEGDIIFEQGNGHVIVEGSSKVKGKIIGGTKEKIKEQ